MKLGMQFIINIIFYNILSTYGLHTAVILATTIKTPTVHEWFHIVVQIL